MQNAEAAEVKHLYQEIEDLNNRITDLEQQIAAKNAGMETAANMLKALITDPLPKPEKNDGQG
jgi:hypothetical protein